MSPLGVAIRLCLEVNQSLVDKTYLGLKEDDPRLAKMFSNLKKVQKENEKSKIKVGIDFQKFQELISEETELNLIKKAFTGTVVLRHGIPPD